MQNQATFCVCFTKTNAKRFLGKQKLSLIPKAGRLPSTKKLFLRLSAWDDELSSTTKIITFLAVLLSKLIPY